MDGLRRSWTHERMTCTRSVHLERGESFFGVKLHVTSSSSLFRRSCLLIDVLANGDEGESSGALLLHCQHPQTNLSIQVRPVLVRHYSVSNPHPWFVFTLPQTC